MAKSIILTNGELAALKFEVLQKAGEAVGSAAIALHGKTSRHKGGPSVDTGGFLFVQNGMIPLISGFGFRKFYGIFYISNRNLNI